MTQSNLQERGSREGSSHGSWPRRWGWWSIKVISVDKLWTFEAKTELKVRSGPSTPYQSHVSPPGDLCSLLTSIPLPCVGFHTGYPEYQPCSYGLDQCQLTVQAKQSRPRFAIDRFSSPGRNCGHFTWFGFLPLLGPALDWEPVSQSLPAVWQPATDQ